MHTHTHTHTGVEQHEYNHLLRMKIASIRSDKRDGKKIVSKWKRMGEKAFTKKRGRESPRPTYFTTIKIHFRFFWHVSPTPSVAAKWWSFAHHFIIDFYRSLLTFDQNTHWLVTPVEQQRANERATLAKERYGELNVKITIHNVKFIGPFLQVCAHLHDIRFGTFKYLFILEFCVLANRTGR